MDVIKLSDGSIKEIHKSENESINTYDGAVLVSKYFLAREINL